jgi:probable F420-dependent oxidoreductase
MYFMPEPAPAESRGLAAPPRLSFGFGVFPYTRFREPGEIAEVVAEAEELGFDFVTLPEHLLTPTWPTADLSTKYWYDLPTLAAFLAGATTRIRFLTSVMVLPYHPPVQMAKALATLDVLSNGRIELGIGAGWMEAEFKRLGIPFTERGAITEEYLRAMIALWTEESPSFHGSYVSFENVSFFPKPVQKPHIPVYVGGTGAAPFRRIAQLAQGWIPMTAAVERIPNAIADIRRRRAAAGRADDPLLVCFGFGMAHDPETARMKHNVDGVESGPRERVTPHEAIAGITALRDAGVTCIPIGFAWQNASELRAELRRFAAQVMPAFR